MLNTNLSTKTLLIAVNKGYYVDKNGNVFNKHNKPRKLNLDSKGYLRFSIKTVNRKLGNVHVHKLQAYQKYGDKLITSVHAHEIYVRHKDGNQINNKQKNILLGTPTDNAKDLWKHKSLIMQAAVKKAAKTKRLFTNTQVKEIRQKVATGIKQIHFANKYKCSKGTISDIVNNKIYLGLYEIYDPNKELPD